MILSAESGNKQFMPWSSWPEFILILNQRDPRSCFSSVLTRTQSGPHKYRKTDQNNADFKKTTNEITRKGLI